MQSFLNIASLSEALGLSFPPETIHPEVRAFLLNLKEGTPLAIACSGGADSIFLTLLIYFHYPHLRRQLYLLHFNHRLRGTFAENDAAFVERLGDSLSLPVLLGFGDGEPGGEASLRSARHTFFKESLKKIDGSILLLGHQLEDAAETVLMRLSRGSGLKGLSAPHPIKKNGPFTYLRPLLGIPSAAIRSTLQSLSIPYCEDHTNSEGLYYRNRIRNDVLPVWQSIAPQDVVSGIARSRMLLEEEDVALEAYLDEHWPNIASTNIPHTWHWQPLISKPHALHRRALWRCLLSILASQKALLEPGQVDFLVNSLSWQKPFKLSYGNGFLIFDGQTLLFETLPPVCGWGPLTLVLGGQVCFPDGATLTLRSATLFDIESAFSKKTDFNTQILFHWDVSSWGKHPFLIIRSWLPGDFSQPLGLKGRQKLQDQWINRKIDAKKRQTLPVILLPSNDVLWAPGLLPSSFARLDSNKNVALSLTYRSSK